MIKVELPWVAQVVGGKLIQPGTSGALFPTGPNVSIERVTIDSRNVQPGDLFIAIQGPRFDGHDYVADALRDGAVAVLTQRQLDINAMQIVVDDTHAGLGLLAAAVKAETKVKTIALTGSSGKTTVKEMCAAILRQRGQVLATEGNFNNDIGVPLTLLNLTHEDDYAVIELGANHAGEIAYTSGLTKPDIALINNVSAAHVEGFGDLQAIAQAKSEIVQGLSPTGVIYTNGNSEFANFWQQEFAHLRHQIFAVESAAQPVPKVASIYARDVQLDAMGCATFSLCQEQQMQTVRVPLPGVHNVANAVAAAAVCYEVGCSLAQVASGLASLIPVPGRMNVHQVNPSLRIIDDTYNANVASAKAAVDVLASFQGLQLLILGDMGELGAQARAYHEEVGAYAQTAGIDKVFTLGELSQSASQAFNGQGGQHFDNQDTLLTALKEIMKQPQELNILVKGSRSARMENVVTALFEHTQQPHAGYASC